MRETYLRKKVEFPSGSEPILSIRGLQTFFRTAQGVVRAVDGVSLDVMPGECLGVVGESGSGKSVTFASVMGLIGKPGWIEGGEILYGGRDLTRLRPREMRRLRGSHIAMTMQDALTALNPALTIGGQIVEVIMTHATDLPSGCAAETEAYWRAGQILRLVGIPAAGERLEEYPHQFSGGMRQRIMIAIALACQPQLLIADEPTTALDVTIQAQVLELIADIRRRLGMSVVLITHDLGVVAEYCERVVVMYAGQIVEMGPTREVISRPRHPYTEGLLASIPDPADPGKTIRPIPGQVPELVDLPPQCRFYSRCANRNDACLRDIDIRPVGDGRAARCVLAGKELRP